MGFFLSKDYLTQYFLYFYLTFQDSGCDQIETVLITDLN